MKKIVCLLLFSVVLCFMTACKAAEQDALNNTVSQNGAQVNSAGSSSFDNNENMSRETGIESGVNEKAENTTSNVESLENITEEKNVSNIEIIVGDRTFSAALYDNEAAEALKSRLPMTLDMSELNGNEKYCYLSDSLPVNAGRPAGIHTGDLMLYGDNCLVLFYESFTTNYSYTPLGHIDNSDGLAGVLGDSSVEVTFQIK